jgi:nitroreductase
MEATMAEILPALAGRFACRSFTSEPVSEGEVASILEAGRIAPSGFGMEPWRFIVARTAEARSAVASACFNQPPATTPPVLIAIVALAEALRPETAYVQDRLLAEAGGPVPEELQAAYRGFAEQTDIRSWAIGQCNFAAMQMMVQATALGLATCPIGGFDGADLSKALRLPAGEVPALLLALGHCADRQGGRRRKAMNSMREDR